MSQWKNRSKHCIQPAKRNNVNKSLYLAWKYVCIFACRHYLFHDAISFPRAKLKENCDLWGTDNFHNKYLHIFFAPNRGYCLHKCSSLQIFCNVHEKKKKLWTAYCMQCGIFSFETVLWYNIMNKKKISLLL